MDKAINITLSKILVVYDNTTANTMIDLWTKYINVKHHFIQDHDGIIDIELPFVGFAN